MYNVPSQSDREMLSRKNGSKGSRASCSCRSSRCPSRSHVIDRGEAADGTPIETRGCECAFHFDQSNYLRLTGPTCEMLLPFCSERSRFFSTQFPSSKRDGEAGTPLLLWTMNPLSVISKEFEVGARIQKINIERTEGSESDELLRMKVACIHLSSLPSLVR